MLRIFRIHSRDRQQKREEQRQNESRKLEAIAEESHSLSSRNSRFQSQIPSYDCSKKRTLIEPNQKKEESFSSISTSSLDWGARFIENAKYLGNKLSHPSFYLKNLLNQGSLAEAKAYFKGLSQSYRLKALDILFFCREMKQWCGPLLTVLDDKERLAFFREVGFVALRFARDLFSLLTKEGKEGEKQANRIFKYFYTAPLPRFWHFLLFIVTLSLLKTDAYKTRSLGKVYALQLAAAGSKSFLKGIFEQKTRAELFFSFAEILLRLQPRETPEDNAILGLALARVVAFAVENKFDPEKTRDFFFSFKSFLRKEALRQKPNLPSEITSPLPLLSETPLLLPSSFSHQGE